MASKRGRKLRVRCPCCGMLVWQSRLSGNHELEFVIQESYSPGAGNIRHKYHRGNVAESEGAKVFQAFLALRMIETAERLLEEVGAGVVVTVQGAEDIEDAAAEVAESAEVELQQGGSDTYEIETGGVVYEIEVPTQLEIEDVKRSLWKAVRGKLSTRKKEVAQVEIEYGEHTETEVDFDDES